MGIYPQEQTTMRVMHGNVHTALKFDWTQTRSL